MSFSRVGRQGACSLLKFLLGSVLTLLSIPQLSLAAPQWVAGQYIVERNPAIAGDGNSAALPGELVKDLGRQTVVITAPSSAIGAQADLQSGITEYNADLDHFCAELLVSSNAYSACSPNYIVQASAVPNDSSYGSLWGMKGSAGINAPSAWDLSTGGSNVVVAIIDTGSDYNHPDLAANMWSNPGEIPGNGRDDDGDGYVDDVHGINALAGTGDPMDDNGHGTHVSGTIGAVGNNARGVVGVNWNVKIMPLKFLSAQGSGSLGDAIKAINYLVDQKGRGVNVRVVNNSWGGGGFSQPMYNAIDRARQAGIIFVAAAGNEANDNDASPSYPASYNLPNVVSVAAIDSSGNIASFSNYGAQEVDIAAPGVDILSTLPNNRYGSLSGTSMATPHVTGALGLLFSYLPNISNDEALARMYDSGRDLSALSGLVRTGRTLDASRLLAGTTSPIPVPPPAPECDYAISQISDAPDTTADATSPVLQADEFGYYSLDLPFSFPFHGEQISTLHISPNGVVYTKSAPSGMDYQNGKTAPLNSIAPLHTDLYPVGGDNGVRVAVGADRATISWKAPLYILRSSTATVRLTVYSSGVISEWITLSDSTLEDYLKTHATIGLKGSSKSSAFTYSSNDNKVRNGLALSFTPNCDESTRTARVLEANITGQNKMGKPIHSIVLGGGLDLVALGSGTGPIRVAFKLSGLNGKKCSPKTVTLESGVALVNGKFPKDVVGVNKLQAFVTGADGVTVSSSIKVQSPKSRARSGSRSAGKMSARQLSNACTSLINSLSE